MISVYCTLLLFLILLKNSKMFCCSFVCFCYDNKAYKGCNFEKPETQDEDINERFENHKMSSMSLKLIENNHNMSDISLKIIENNHNMSGMSLKLIENNHNMSGMSLKLIENNHNMPGMSLKLIENNHNMSDMSLKLIRETNIRCKFLF